MGDNSEDFGCRRRENPFGSGAPLLVLESIGPRNAQLPFVAPLNGDHKKGWSWPHPSAWRIGLQLQGKESITDPYAESAVVHACLKVFSQALASLELVLWQTADEDAEPVPEGDPLVRLLCRKPNPLMSGGDLLALHALNRKLSGEDFWFLEGADGQPLKSDPLEPPARIWPVRGDLVRPILDRENMLPVAYAYRVAGGKERTFPASSVLLIRDVNPNDHTRGSSETDALARVLDNQFQAERYQNALLRHAGDVGGIIKIKGRLEPEQRRQIEEQANDRLDPERAGLYRVVDNDAEYIRNEATAKDMEYATLDDRNVEKICGVYGVPPMLIGVHRTSTYNNLREAKRALWLGGNGVLTASRTLENALNAFFFPRLRDGKQSKYWARFDISSIEELRDDTSAKLVSVATAVQTGVGLSLNEAAAAAQLEWDPPKNGDVHYTSPQLIPEGRAGNADPAEIEADIAALDDAPAISALDPSLVSTVLSIVSQVAAGTLPRDSGKGVLMLLGLTDEQAEVVLADAGKGTATQPNKPEGAEDPDSKPAEEEDDDEDEEDVDGDKALRTRDRAAPYTEPHARTTEAEEQKAARVAWFKGFEAAVLFPNDRKIMGATKAWMKSFRAGYIRRLREFAEGTGKGFRGYVAKDISGPEDLDALELDMAEWIAKYKRRIHGPLVTAYERAVKHAADEIGAFALSIDDVRLLEALSTQEIQLSEGVASRLAREVRLALFETLTETEAGTSIADLQQAIKDLLPELEGAVAEAFGDLDARALNIARTESGHAASSAREIQFVEEGVEEHEWISAGDVDVRPEHEKVDGEVRPLGTLFSNGMRRPHDPSAPVELVANCRCTTRAIVPKEE